MAFIEEKDDAPPPLIPFLGFIVLLLAGALAFVGSPYLIEFLTTTQLSLGFMDLLPITFPADWSFLVQRLVVSIIVFLAVFIVMMIVWSTMTGKDADPQNVDLATIRKRKEAQRKRR